MTSELKTKKSPDSLFSRKIDSASLIGPAVPSGSVSRDIVILIPYLVSYSAQAAVTASGMTLTARITSVTPAPASASI